MPSLVIYLDTAGDQAANHVGEDRLWLFSSHGQYCLCMRLGDDGNSRFVTLLPGQVRLPTLHRAHLGVPLGGLAVHPPGGGISGNGAIIVFSGLAFLPKGCISFMCQTLLGRPNFGARIGVWGAGARF